MKKLALSLTIIAAGLSVFPVDASAQRLIVETPNVRLVPGSGRGDRRVGYELDRLNRDIQQVRAEIRVYRGGGRRIRYRFERVMRAAERLNNDYDRRVTAPYETRRRIEQVRDELDDIRRDLRMRGDIRDDGPRGWR